ncbi:hypothetical protein KEJ27_05610 [Candidatus Bathyarchaeota archaeon]|nr:hypothetical protein [Candidatus Bathyarchaeota archaeon]MBS7612755.1 hypothetical protein [Candidatus Bathyarchaeota archaeon]MBS7612757.1 hypothetical protein [Candidatus Bathyarchaeota archaeon]MBS7617726.1 hypothetical protein [Candidatus Bathyarchaeota archaeon]
MSCKILHGAHGKTRLKRLRTPSFFDAIILATSKALGAKPITGDEHFKGISGMIRIGKT